MTWSNPPQKRHIIMVLDETGSMEQDKERTKSAVNEFISTLQQKKDDAVLSVYKFSTFRKELVYDRRPISEVGKFEVYEPSGGTDLYDAVGDMITRYSDDKEVLLVCVTDGQENESRRYTRQQITTMIADKKAKGWSINFIGADFDAWTGTGRGLGLGMNNTYSAPKMAMAGTMRGMGAVANSWRGAAAGSAEYKSTSENFGAEVAAEVAKETP